MIGRERGGAAPEGELTEALIGRRLDAMPALPRSVFLLHHLDGLDHAAIGDRLGLDAEAVEQQLRQAMRVLVWGADERPG
jgi:DNA-directed RNA polymerase specialized sigma24 family protein